MGQQGVPLDLGWTLEVLTALGEITANQLKRLVSDVVGVRGGRCGHGVDAETVGAVPPPLRSVHFGAPVADPPAQSAIGVLDGVRALGHRDDEDASALELSGLDDRRDPGQVVEPLTQPFLVQGRTQGRPRAVFDAQHYRS
ncbi:MAG: hypothetical protein ACOYXW_11975, partial [Actinomycetota bacterium]